MRLTLPRTTPARPISRISRSTVQRATRMYSRLSCFQILSAPLTPKCSRCTRATSTFSAASDSARFDGGLVLAA